MTQEQESDLVLLGKIIEEASFKGIKVKNIVIDQKVSIDFIRDKEFLMLHDVKKIISSKLRTSTK
ncbi:Dna2/Cas4 domain-containing protein [Candidatus Bathyarchaeota archaeon]|nr:Dna2/Cas4 domain-containing protein [Candidatus Bathyarchaeota archaeon]